MFRCLAKRLGQFFFARSLRSLQEEIAQRMVTSVICLRDSPREPLDGLWWNLMCASLTWNNEQYPYNRNSFHKRTVACIYKYYADPLYAFNFKCPLDYNTKLIQANRRGGSGNIFHQCPILQWLPRMNILHHGTPKCWYYHPIYTVSKHRVQW
jgi:hypothetical protein